MKNDPVDFLKRYAYDDNALVRANITWDELMEVANNHRSNMSELKTKGEYINNRLMLEPTVHSVSYRIKDEEHLVEKVIRKNIDAKCKRITLDNYKEEITDLIGLRALHIFKEEWEPIHNYIKGIFSLKPKEKPKVYYRKGDSETYLGKYVKAGLSKEEHRQGYRSIHYTIVPDPLKKKSFAEIQVRSIYEEAWSEIDHRIKYPYVKKDIPYARLLFILNGLSGTADELGSFTNVIKNVYDAIEKRLIIKGGKNQEMINYINNAEIHEEVKSHLLNSFTAMYQGDLEFKDKLEEASSKVDQISLSLVNLFKF